MLTCLLMGSKVEELDDYIPFIKHMEKYFSLHLAEPGQVPQWTEVVEFERKVAKFFNWDLLRFNTHTFLSYFIVNGICFNDEKEAQKSKRVNELYERCMREAEKSTK